MAVRRSDKMPPVGAAMTPFPYFVEESDPVEDVSRLMAEHAIRHVPVLRDGRVVGIVSARAPHVVKKGKLAGILSVTDVCRVLAEILREQFPASGGNDAA